MQEIGGYIELDKYTLPMLHDGAIALNCGRCALAYLIRAKKIKKLLMPRFNCASVIQLCLREHVVVRYYDITETFLPEQVDLEKDEWLYLINYYGQLSNEQIVGYSNIYKRVIVDNAQAYFQMPVNGVDTLYTCRKFFGVPDGAFLYTDTKLNVPLPRDESFERMHFLLGRFERTASEFYQESVQNNRFFADEDIKTMSRLTNNLLHALDYSDICKRRTDNFICLHQLLGNRNGLELKIPEGAFMYPLYLDDGVAIRRELQKMKIYIPVLWPNVLEEEESLERRFAENILPLPCDQRYGSEEMLYMAKTIEEIIHSR